MPRRSISADELERRAGIYQAAMNARSPARGPVEIAEKAGLKDHSQVSRIVRGECEGSTPRIRAIARVLGIPFSQLVDEPERQPLEEATSP
jgi:transcriptional regulator with XRE-family HTH domain